MKTPSEKRRGRPPKGSALVKTNRIDIRLTDAEKEGFGAAAELAGLELSAWIRERLRQVARKELQSANQPIAFLNGK